MYLIPNFSLFSLIHAKVLSTITPLLFPSGFLSQMTSWTIWMMKTTKKIRRSGEGRGRPR